MINVLALNTTPDRPERAMLCDLARNGVSLTVLTESPESFAGTPGITVESQKLGGRFDLLAAWRIRRLVQGRRIEIIHSFSGRSLSIALLGTLGLPVKHIAYRGTVGHLARWDPMSWLSFLNPRVSRLICVSEAVRRYLIEQGVQPERAVTIYKGHSLEWYKTAPVVTRSDLGIPEDAILCGFLGNMRKIKGADLLVQAVDSILEPQKVHLLLIGEVRDPQIVATLSQMRHKHRVHCVGFRADGASLLRLCDLHVMPSRDREGFPKAVIEGMAQGVPPIVSEVGGMPELVIDNESGLIVKPNDVEALTRAILRLASDSELRSRLGNAARQRIARSFTISETVRRTLELYRALTPDGSKIPPAEQISK